MFPEIFLYILYMHEMKKMTDFSKKCNTLNSNFPHKNVTKPKRKSSQQMN